MTQSHNFFNEFLPGIPVGELFGGHGKRNAGSSKNGALREDVSDADLVRESLGGDDGGFTTLVERYLPMIYKFVYRYLQNADDSRDVSQETFIKAWKHLKRFDMDRSFKTWLLAIAKNASLDFIKKKKPVLFSRIEESDIDLDAFLAPYMDMPDLPNEVLEQKDAKVMLTAALEKLTPSYRAVLTLRYHEHLKFREIAATLGEPIDTVKSKHRRGLVLLRKLIEEQPH